MVKILDRLFGRRGARAEQSPDELRERLFDAVQADDAAALRALCEGHRAQIEQHFPSWKQIPADVRGAPHRLRRYAEGLIGVARCFAEALGQPSLLAALSGPPGGNPIERWRSTVGRALAHMENLEFDEACAVLEAAETAVRKLSGGDAGRMLAVTLGRLGECHFGAGRVAQALPLYRQALGLCRANDDAEGVAAYLSSLFEVHRYLAQGEEAGAMAVELGDLLERKGQSTRARRYRKLAAVARGGEPKNRVVIEQDGVVRELDELGEGPVGGRVRFLFCRNRISIPRAVGLVERGRALGAENRIEEALALFREAGAVDPHAPEPHFEAALSLLHLERAAEAAASYDRVEALAPGWYHGRAERWLAAEIAAGRVPHRVFLALRLLEDGPNSAEDKVRLAQGCLAEAPDLPALYLHLGKQLAALGQVDKACAALARGLDRAVEPCIKTQLLVQAASLEPPSAARDQKLCDAITLNGDLIASAMALFILHAGASGAAMN